MRYSRFFMTGLMLTIFTVMVAISSQYPAGARFMTFVVGFPAIALCLLQLFLDLRAYRNEAASPAMAAAARVQTEAPMPAGMIPDSNAEISTPEMIRKEIIVWSWVVGLIVSILLFGFYITVPIFLVGFLRLYGQAGWRMTILLPAAVCTVLYVMLGYVFRMTLHIGFITEYLMDRISG